MVWTPPERNFNNIQFETLRRQIDDKFNQVHDELSAAYYGGQPFRTFGVLDKVTFDRIHGLIFHLRDVAFHEANMKQPVKNRIPVAEYDYLDEAGTVRKSVFSAEKVVSLRAEGIELTI